VPCYIGIRAHMHASGKGEDSKDRVGMLVDHVKPCNMTLCVVMFRVELFGVSSCIIVVDIPTHAHIQNHMHARMHVYMRMWAGDVLLYVARKTTILMMPRHMIIGFGDNRCQEDTEMPEEDKQHLRSWTRTASRPTLLRTSWTCSTTPAASPQPSRRIFYLCVRVWIWEPVKPLSDPTLERPAPPRLAGSFSAAPCDTQRRPISPSHMPSGALPCAER